MADGYPTRTPTRQSFAFEPVRPAASPSAATGQSRGAQIVGGESQGGAVAQGPQTDPAPIGAGLGQFFEQLMEPHLKQRQQEEFFKGYTRAQSGVALSELDKSGTKANAFFGTPYAAQGAQFFAARTKLDDWTVARYGEIDTLKKLPPDELAKVLATKSQELLTGNPGADMLIQSGLLESYGPLNNAVAKARVEWQQSDGLNNWANSASAAGDAFQAAAQAQTALDQPTDKDNSGFAGAGQKFLSSLIKPEGMTDETYKTGMYNAYVGYMQRGNFFAVRALKAAGIDKMFDPDQQIKLEDTYHRYAQRKMGDAVMAYLLPDIGALEDQMAKGHLTPLDVQNELVRMNNVIKSKTGVEEDLFDWKDIQANDRTVMATVLANWRRAQERKWQIEDRNFAAAQKQNDIQQENASVRAAWAAGDVNGAIALGLPDTSFNAVALAEYRGGDYSGLQRSFIKGKWVSPAVKNEVQAGIESSVGEQYGKNFERSHQQWLAMNKLNPGMTASYYGDWNDKMRAFDTLSRQLGPQMAFTRAFGDPSKYSAASLPPEIRREAEKAIDAAVATKQPSWYNVFGTSLNTSAVRVMKGAITDRVALGIKNSDSDPTALARESLDASIADGTVQVAGEFAWRAAKGTKPFDKQIGLQADEAGVVFKRVTDEWLRKAGFSDGASSSAAYDIDYVQTPHNGTALHIVARKADGSDRRSVIIPLTAYKKGRDQLYPKKPGGKFLEGAALGAGYLTN